MTLVVGRSEVLLALLLWLSKTVMLRYFYHFFDIKLSLLSLLGTLILYKNSLTWWLGAGFMTFAAGNWRSYVNSWLTFFDLLAGWFLYCLNCSIYFIYLILLCVIALFLFVNQFRWKLNRAVLWLINTWCFFAKCSVSRFWIQICFLPLVQIVIISLLFNTFILLFFGLFFFILLHWHWSGTLHWIHCWFWKALGGSHTCIHGSRFHWFFRWNDFWDHGWLNQL